MPKVGACRLGDLALFDLAMTLGADALSDANDQTCLHHAAANDRAVLIAALLFDPDFQGEGVQEMLSAAFAPRTVAVERFLESHADNPEQEELRRPLLRDP